MEAVIISHFLLTYIDVGDIFITQKVINISLGGVAMKTKVSLKELVGTKIVYALLLFCYYWMWARRDWHDYYMSIQYAVAGFTILFLLMQVDRIRKYSKETKDEMAIQNLRRADTICLKIMIVAAVVIAFAGAITVFDGIMSGYALVGTILVLSIIRFLIFCIMDSKGV